MKIPKEIRKLDTDEVFPNPILEAIVRDCAQLCRNGSHRSDDLGAIFANVILRRYGLKE